jgi:hypothetical protein
MNEGMRTMQKLLPLMVIILIIVLAPMEGRAMDQQQEMKVLEGVPKVNFDTRFCSFTASLESVMTYLGDPIDYDYAMGVSGLAFRRIWEQNSHGNQFPAHFEPEAVYRTFWVLGYDCQIISHKQGRAALLTALKQSLDKGRPVIACGIVGPAEYEVITGYGKGGDILYGWSQFQEHEAWHKFKDPTIPGYYAKPNW